MYVIEKNWNDLTGLKATKKIGIKNNKQYII